MSDFESLSLENQEAIEELAWTLNASRGEFKLVIVRCNYAQLRDRAIVALRERVEDVVVWAMPSETTALLEGIREVSTAQTTAVMVMGLEGTRELDELLSSTNRIREEFRSACPFPVVLWVTDRGLRSLMRSAPDFESWGTTTHLEISIEELAEWLEARTQEWFRGELNQYSRSQTEWVSFNQEFVLALDRIKSSPVLMRQEVPLCSLAVLGAINYNLGLSDDAIECFENCLRSWEGNVWPDGQARVLEELVKSYRNKANLQRDRNHLDWQEFDSIVDKYLAFCLKNCPQKLPCEIASFLGDILTSLKKWDVLQVLAEQAIPLSLNKTDHVIFARPNGYLAEVAIAHQNWKEALIQSEEAIRKLESVKVPRVVVPEGVLNPELVAMRIDKGWCQRLCAKAKASLGDRFEAITILECARAELYDCQHNQYYVDILNDLEELYRSQKNYIKAFETKQERFSVEQQMGWRAFVGAGWLRPQEEIRFDLEPFRSEVRNAGVSSAIRSSGRSKDIQNLLDRIASTEYKLTILHGASGVGKSSLVEGGLVPALRQKAIGTRDNVPVLIRQYNNWVGAILEALGELTGEIEAVLAKLRSNEERNLRTVLIFDQFEEFFFVQHDRVARQRFYSFLREAIEFSNVKVILSLREDYLHYLLECRSEMSMINDGDVLSRKVLYEIGNFSRVDARSIIEDLTTRSQFTLEPALLDRLVADLAEPLGEVRPIELQIVGAQLQAEGIRTLADYPVGGKAELVDRYLMGTIGDCGEGNGELAELVGYLLTDERGTRPLKTRDELVREMGDLKRSPLPEQLDLVLAVLVGSGLVMWLKESPDDRYQLVHDYLAGVIRDRQKPQFDRLAKELDEEKEKRKLAERNLETVHETLIGLQEETQRTEARLELANNQVVRRKKQGTGILIGSIAMLSIASVGSFRAFQLQQESQTGTRLERAGAAAIEEFKSQQTKGLLSAMRSVYPLIPFE